MASSLIWFHEKSLWAGDYILRVILYYLEPSIKEARKEANSLSKSNQDWLQTYYEDLIWYLEGFSVGSIDFEFEEIAKDSYRINLIKTNLQKLRRRLIDMKPSVLSLKKLHKVDSWNKNSDFYSVRPIPTKEIVNLIDELLLMLPVYQGADSIDNQKVS